ncbi:MAG: hypothetical protein DA408_05920 [Bacteroidetes bacterium]|nr:MAG: hypothetical protein DA408_05920 [Bacteroidota bacterium]
MPKYMVSFVMLLSVFTLRAQLPQSNIYLFDVKQVSDSLFEFTHPQFLTGFNPNGYNNQPAFFSNDELYISAQLPAMQQPELYLLNLKEKTKLRVTETQEGEFSAMRMPDYYNFSAIRQEYINRDTVIRLWQFPLDRLTNGKPVFKYLQGIGYYTWVNSKEVAVFVLDNPNYLALANVDTDELLPLATNVGRCIKKLPNGNLTFVQKNEQGIWQIMELSLYRRTNLTPQPIITSLVGAEDFALLPDGSYIMGKGSKLYKFNRFRDEDWVEIADLRFYNITNIFRLAISPDMKIAIVAN